MLRAVVASFLVVVFVSMPAAQTAEQEVTKAEHARAAARQKADSAALLRIASDDQLTVGPLGQPQDNKATAALTAAPKLALGEIRTQLFGDVAVVTGTQSGLGDKFDGQQRFTRVWHRRNGQWINVFGQVTRIAPATPAAGQTSKLGPTQWPEGKTQDERDVFRSQRALNEAYARKDAKTYAGLTTDSFTRIAGNGEVNSKAEFLKFVTATPDVTRVESNNAEFRLRIYGSIALLTYIDRTPTGSPAGTRMTRIFAKQDGTWKQLVTQLTSIQPVP
jgi:ketosteroid isomerase-like protein